MTREEREVTLAELREKNLICAEKRSWPVAMLDQLLLQRSTRALITEGLKVNRVRREKELRGGPCENWWRTNLLRRVEFAEARQYWSFASRGAESE